MKYRLFFRDECIAEIETREDGKINEVTGYRTKYSNSLEQNKDLVFCYLMIRREVEKIERIRKELLASENDEEARLKIFSARMRYKAPDIRYPKCMRCNTKKRYAKLMQSCGNEPDYCRAAADVDALLNPRNQSWQSRWNLYAVPRLFRLEKIESGDDNNE